MKIRVRFSKLGRVRWTSHRDVARMWERALRRAGVPLSYTAGFSPRPQLSFGLALPTGCESTAEYLDVAVAAPTDPASVGAVVGPLLPDGVEVTGAAELAPGSLSLQEAVTSCTWEIAVPGVAPDALDAVIGRVLDADTLPVRRERKGRGVLDDLRPLVRALSCPGPYPGGALLRADVGTRPRGVRPSELAQVMGVALGSACRTRQWIERDGSRWEPLSPDGDVAVLGAERAS